MKYKWMFYGYLGGYKETEVGLGLWTTAYLVISDGSSGFDRGVLLPF